MKLFIFSVPRDRTLIYIKYYVRNSVKFLLFKFTLNVSTPYFFTYARVCITHAATITREIKHHYFIHYADHESLEQTNNIK
jgi:hypothetical protein